MATVYLEAVSSMSSNQNERMYSYGIPQYQANGYLEEDRKTILRKETI